MPLLFEIRVRINGEERWADARKMFDYLYKECVNKDYKGDGEIPLSSEEKNEQFMSWWNLYAKKTDKKKTQKYWNRNIKQKDFDKIMDHTRKYVETTEKQFRKNPHSYLLNESYENEIIIDEETKQERKDILERQKKEKWIDKEYRKTMAMRTPDQGNKIINGGQVQVDLSDRKQQNTEHNGCIISAEYESASHEEIQDIIKGIKGSLKK